MPTYCSSTPRAGCSLLLCLRRCLRCSRARQPSGRGPPLPEEILRMVRPLRIVDGLRLRAHLHELFLPLLRPRIGRQSFVAGEACAGDPTPCVHHTHARQTERRCGWPGCIVLWLVGAGRHRSADAARRPRGWGPGGARLARRRARPPGAGHRPAPAVGALRDEPAVCAWTGASCCRVGRMILCGGCAWGRTCADKRTTGTAND